MLQHCDAVLMLDNDSQLKQAAAKHMKSALSSPGAVGGGGSVAAGSVGVTLSDANKALFPSFTTEVLSSYVLQAATPPIVDLLCDSLAMPLKEVTALLMHRRAYHCFVIITIINIIIIIITIINAIIIIIIIINIITINNNIFFPQVNVFSVRGLAQTLRCGHLNPLLASQVPH
jgi:hypothetical protein